uniref:Uncharacterized protein n=1 Tax=Rhizophora mucronata TaxID=61149 RepID=A0A2P2QLL7_RHIMU
MISIQKLRPNHCWVLVLDKFIFSENNVSVNWLIDETEVTKVQKELDAQREMTSLDILKQL